METTDRFYSKKSIIALLMSVFFLVGQFVAIAHSAEHPICNHQDNSCHICIIADHIADVTHDVAQALHNDIHFILVGPPPLVISPLRTVSFSSGLSRAPPVVSA